MVGRGRGRKGYSVAGSSYPSAVWHHVQNVNFYYVWSGAGKFVLLKYLFAPILLCVCAWCVCVNWCVPLANNAKLALFIYANGCGQEAPLAARNAGCSQCQHGEQLCSPRTACPSYSPRMVFRADCFIIMCLRFTKTIAPKESIMMARMAPSRMMNHGCVNTSFT